MYLGTDETTTTGAGGGQFPHGLLLRLGLFNDVLTEKAPIDGELGQLLALSANVLHPVYGKDTTILMSDGASVGSTTTGCSNEAVVYSHVRQFLLLPGHCLGRCLYQLWGEVPKTRTQGNKLTKERKSSFFLCFLQDIAYYFAVHSLLIDGQYDRILREDQTVSQYCSKVWLKERQFLTGSIPRLDAQLNVSFHLLQFPVSYEFLLLSQGLSCSQNVLSELIKPVVGDFVLRVKLRGGRQRAGDQGVEVHLPGAARLRVVHSRRGQRTPFSLIANRVRKLTEFLNKELFKLVNECRFELFNPDLDADSWLVQRHSGEDIRQSDFAISELVAGLAQKEVDAVQRQPAPLQLGILL